MGYVSEDGDQQKNNQNTQNIQNMNHSNHQNAPQQQNAPLLLPQQKSVETIEEIERKYKQILKAMQGTINELKDELASHKLLIQYQNEKIKELEKDKENLQHQITEFVKQMAKEEPVKPNYNPILARPNDFNQPSPPKSESKQKSQKEDQNPQYKLHSVQEQVMKYIQQFADHLDKINYDMSQKKYSKIKYKILNMYIPTCQALETGLSFIIEKVTSDAILAERLSDLTRDLTTLTNERFPDFMKKSLSTQLQERFDTNFRMGQKTGIIPFIIECYKKHLLSTTFIHDILTMLLLERGIPSEFDVQVMQEILLSGIGKRLDSDKNSKEFVAFFYGQMNQLYVNQFLNPNHKKIFKNLLDLRLNHWVPKGRDLGDWYIL